MASVDEIKQALKATLNETLAEKLGVGQEDAVNLPQIQTDIALLQTDIALLQTDIALLQTDIALLVSMNPDAALKKINPVLVGHGTDAEGVAVREGADSTWTYMRSEGLKMAVGAAHCVSHFKIKRRRLSERVLGHLQNSEFVEIPPALKHRVTHVGFCGNYMDVRNDSRDVAILLLDRFPEGVDETKAIEWRAYDDNPDPSVHAKVGGLSLSGSVRGHGCYVGATIRFVEDSGEGGQSGTLIFNLTPPQGTDPYVIGVYYGVRRVGRGLEKRGVVVKLPQLQRIRWYPKQDARLQSSDQLALKKRKRRSGTRYYQTNDGFQFGRVGDTDETLHGFFVNTNFVSTTNITAAA